MRFNLILIILVGLVFADPHESLDVDFLKQTTPPKIKLEEKPPTKVKDKNSLPKFNEVIDGMEKIEGLLTFYRNVDKNKLFLALSEEEIEQIYFFNMTRNSGDGYYYDGGSMLWEFPFIFKKIGDKLQLVNINTSFRADSDTPILNAIENNLSHSIIATTSIISQAHPDSKYFIVDASALFLKDLTYVSQRGKGKYIFDKSNSYFKVVSSFPQNVELEISAHFKSNNWTDSYTLPDSHSMIHSYHFSISPFINNDYRPRVQDDRIGYFTTIYQDYTNIEKETPYVRYINRWNLKKKYPQQQLSEPVEPIVFWLENTIPYEYRPAVSDGILAWNKAFEAIGFKNAIIVKQMPDDADWDPGDSRYNTIRWVVQPGSAYAVGPSRANPYTGEIYDADIRIMADFVRAFYNEYDEFVLPVTSYVDPISFWAYEDSLNMQSTCNYAEDLNNQMILSWHTLTSLNIIKDTNKNLDEYIYKGLVDLVLHEVGHTLGLRHNFKASSIYSIEDLSNPLFTEKYGMSGSVMDYHPVCLLDKGHTMFQTEPGPYDFWAIEYGYSEFPSYNEVIYLENIANQSNNPLYSYGTDEDAFGLSSRGIDPLCSTWDMSDNPIAYYNNQLDLVDKLWEEILNNYEKEGNRFQKIRSVFSQGISEYYSASRTAAKFIGGIHFSRNHIGDPNVKNPLIIVDAIKQREALQFIIERIFSKDAFNFDPNLLNKLAPERNDDFTDYVWRMNRLDYPLHNVIERIQSVALYSIFHPRRISRIQDNELRMTNQDDIFTMHELFDSVASAVWTELVSLENINSFRRNLQNTYINLSKVIILNGESFPHDAKIFCRQNLQYILKGIYYALSNNDLDYYSKAHLENCANDIELILEAKISLN